MADLTLEPTGTPVAATSPDAPRRPAGSEAGIIRSADARALRVAIGPATSVSAGAALVVSPLAVSPVPPGASAQRGSTGDPALEAPVESDRVAISDTGPAASPTVLVDGDPVAVRLVRRGPARASLVVGEGSSAARHRVVFTGTPVVGADGLTRREVVVDGWRIEVETELERRAALRERARRGRETVGHGGPTEVRAIIPGRVVAVHVEPGDAVTAGQQVLVVEAMKMQNELRSPRDGTIRRVDVQAGATIEVGDLMLVIE